MKSANVNVRLTTRVRGLLADAGYPVQRDEITVRTTPGLHKAVGRAAKAVRRSQRDTASLIIERCLGQYLRDKGYLKE